VDCPRSRPRFNRYCRRVAQGKNTERDPRVSLSIIDFDDPYTEAQMRGRVIERRPDPQLKYYDSLSHNTSASVALPRRKRSNYSRH